MSRKKNRGSIPAAPQADVPTSPLAETSQPTASVEAAPKKVRSNRPAGLGYPEAKKLVNPQHTLEAKKAAVAKLGGRMVWTNKNWSINVPAGEFSFPSRELAGLSVATLLDRVAKAPTKAAPVESTEAEMA